MNPSGATGWTPHSSGVALRVGGVDRDMIADYPNIGMTTARHIVNTELGRLQIGDLLRNTTRLNLKARAITNDFATAMRLASAYEGHARLSTSLVLNSSVTPIIGLLSHSRRYVKVNTIEIDFEFLTGSTHYPFDGSFLLIDSEDYVLIAGTDKVWI